MSDEIVKAKDVVQDFINNYDTAQMLEFTKRIQELVNESESLKGINTGKKEYSDSKKAIKTQHVNKSTEEITDILSGMLKVAKDAEEYGKESRFKVPSLRFADLKDLSFEDKRQEIEASADKLWDEFKIKIRLIKGIDTLDVTKDKYLIELRDNNNNRVTLDYLEYQKKIYDFTVDEEQVLQDEIVKLRGTYDSDVISASKEAAKYISLCLAFNEMLVYRYKYIGWQTIFHSVKKEEYDYLKEYRKDIGNARKVLKLYKAQVYAEYENVIKNKNVDAEIIENIITNRYNEIANALHLNDSHLDKKYIHGEKELIFKYNKLYAHGLNSNRLGFCGEKWAESLDFGDYNEENNYKFNEFYAHTFNNSTKGSLILCAAVSGIIRQLLRLSKEYGININILGEAASGKSTLQNLVISFFGDPNGLASSFIDSDNAKEEERVSRVLLPYVIDDKLLNSIDAAENKRGLEAFMDIFREYEGRNKQKVGLKSDNTNRFYGAVISSSVESIFELIEKSKIQSKDLGQVRRLIEIKIDKNDVFKANIDGISASTHAETATELSNYYYGYGVPQIIEYMYLMMKYQYIYRIILAYGVSLKDSFKLADLVIRKMETGDDKNIEELDKEFEKIGIKNTLPDLINYLIDQKIAFKMDENNEEIFRGLLRVAESEMEDTMKSPDYIEYSVTMASSKQRFSLLILTGYIINYALNYSKFKNFKTNIAMNMNMNAITSELLSNLKEKIDRTNSLIKVEENINAGTKEADVIATENQQAAEKVPTVEDVIKIYDWLIMNQKYFYIDEVGSSTKILINDIDKFIGRIRVEDGVGLKLTVHTNNKKKVFEAISTCNNKPEDILEYKYDGRAENCDFADKKYIAKLLLLPSKFIYLISEKRTNKQIKKENQKGLEYIFNVDAIEEARKALNQDSEDLEKAEETVNVEEAVETAEESNPVEKKSEEAVGNPVEEDNQGESANETN